MSSSKNVLSVQSNSSKRKKASFQEFLTDVQGAICNSGGEFRPYKQISVFMMRWAKKYDDIGVESVESELKDIFERLFNFTVVQYVIDPTGAAQYEFHRKISRALIDFIEKHDKPGCLTIYVYSGHGTFEPDKDKYWIHGQQNGVSMGFKLDWKALGVQVASSPAGEILLIFDSCFAGHLSKNDGPELLATADHYSQASADPDASFTKAFCQVLKDTNGASTSIANLYAMMMRYNTILTAIPIHVCKPGHASIVLHKVDARNSNSMRQKQAKVLTNVNTSRGQIRGTNAIIAVRCQKNMNAADVPQFTKWLTTNMPAGVSPGDIKLHGIWQANSTVALVSMPVELWTMLPANDEAYDFVSFVNSDNLLAPQEPLGEVKQQGENLPPKASGSGSR